VLPAETVKLAAPLFQWSSFPHPLVNTPTLIVCPPVASVVGTVQLVLNFLVWPAVNACAFQVTWSTFAPLELYTSRSIRACVLAADFTEIDMESDDPRLTVVGEALALVVHPPEVKLAADAPFRGVTLASVKAMASSPPSPITVRRLDIPRSPWFLEESGERRGSGARSA
jgi:hypothetical protein